MVITAKPINVYWNGTIDNSARDFRQYVKASDFDPLVQKAKSRITELNKGKVEEGDSVFFHSSSTIPRYKFSFYTNGKDIRRVIKSEKASKIVINSEAFLGKLKSSFSYAHDYFFLPHDFFTRLGVNCPVTINEGEQFVMDRYAYGQLNNINRPQYGKPAPAKTIVFPDPKTLTTIKCYDITASSGTSKNALREIEDIINDDKTVYVDDKVLNEQMGEESIVIDENNFKDYDDMLKSTDATIRSTAMELIANSNYQDSIFYISLLLNGNINAVNSVGNKTVNIKNFLDYFRTVKWGENIPSFLKTLRKKLKSEGKLDNIKEEYIHKHMLNYINNVIGHAGVSVTEVHFSDD